MKSAILLAGLFAKGKTTVDEPAASRNHTELMFNYFLVRTVQNERSVSVFGDQIPESRDFSIPGDISSAAFWLVAAAAQPGGQKIAVVRQAAQPAVDRIVPSGENAAAKTQFVWPFRWKSSLPVVASQSRAVRS